MIISGGASNLDTPPLYCSQDVLNRNDKSEPVPHLEDSVRIIMSCNKRLKSISYQVRTQNQTGAQRSGSGLERRSSAMSAL